MPRRPREGKAEEQQRLQEEAKVDEARLKENARAEKETALAKTLEDGLRHTSRKKEDFGLVLGNDNSNHFVAVTRDPELTGGKSIAFVLEEYLRTTGKASGVVVSVHMAPEKEEGARAAPSGSWQAGQGKKEDVGHVVVRFDNTEAAQLVRRVFGEIGGKHQVGPTLAVKTEEEVLVGKKARHPILQRGDALQAMISLLSENLGQTKNR